MEGKEMKKEEALIYIADMWDIAFPFNNLEG